MTDVDLEQDVRVVGSWRRIAEVDRNKLSGPISRTVHVERSALLALVEIAERGIEARKP